MRRASPLFGVVAFRLIAIAALLAVLLAGGATAATTTQQAQAAHAEAVVGLLLLERRVADATVHEAQAQDRLRSLEAEAEETARLASEAERDLHEAQDRYAARMVETYKIGGSGWLGILLGSGDLREFLGRTFLLGRILGQDAAVADRVEQALERFETASEDAQEAVAAQQAQVAALRSVRDELEAAKSAQAELVKSLGDRLAAARAAAAAAARRMAEVNAGVKTTRTTTATTGSASPTTASTRPAVPDTPQGQGRQLAVKSYAYALSGTTATGVPVARGIVAVDPRVIPLGTRLYIPGYGEGIAADTGRDIIGNTIDVWMPSLAEARAWGTRYLTITVYD